MRNLSRNPQKTRVLAILGYASASVIAPWGLGISAGDVQAAAIDVNAAVRDQARAVNEGHARVAENVYWGNVAANQNVVAAVQNQVSAAENQAAAVRGSIYAARQAHTLAAGPYGIASPYVNGLASPYGLGLGLGLRAW